MIPVPVDKMTMKSGDQHVQILTSSPGTGPTTLESGPTCGKDRMYVDGKYGYLAGVMSSYPHSTGPTIPTKFISNSVVVEKSSSLCDLRLPS